MITRDLPHQHGRYQSIWFFKGKIYVPSIVRTDQNGYFLERDPVVCRDVSRATVEAALKSALADPPIVREPSPLPDSPVRSAAGEPSLNRFHQEALGFGVYDYIGGDWEIGATAWPTGAARVEVVHRVKVAREDFPTAAVDIIMTIADKWPVWHT